MKPSSRKRSQSRQQALPAEKPINAWVVYDSISGNTRTIAEAIALSIGEHVPAIRADKVDAGEAKSLDLLVVGSPTHGGRPTEKITHFVAAISPALPAGIKVAAFDTRLSTGLVKIFGYAADRIAASLKAGGAGSARLVGVEGFVVTGRAGPLGKGEVQRAAGWGRQLAL